MSNLTNSRKESKFSIYYKEWAERYQNGASIHQLGKEYNCSNGPIERALEKHGIKHRPRYQRKIRSHSFFLDNIQINTKTNCWEWTFSKNKSGYGQLRMNNKFYAAHRYAYEYYKGAIPQGGYVCHKCDNPVCVNPEHLFLGTAGINMIDMVIKKRHPNILLTVSQVKEIKSLLNNGIYFKDVAAKFNVNPPVITKIKNGVTWRHV